MNPRIPDMAETFAAETRNGFHLFVRREYMETLVAQGAADPEKLALDPGEGARLLSGRGRPLSVPIRGRPPERMVVRKYLHGGLSGPLFGGIFFGASRSVREARLAACAAARGVPTYVPLAAVTKRFLGLFYRAWLVSLEIQGGTDLVEFFRMGPAPDCRRRVIEIAGRAVRKMHDCGILHADLHVKNILARGADGPEPELFLLDWDRSRVLEALSVRQRVSNLLRLDRSADKLSRRGVAVTARDRQRFLRGYLGGDAMFDPRMLAGRGIGRRLHHFLWSVGDLFR